MSKGRSFLETHMTCEVISHSDQLTCQKKNDIKPASKLINREFFNYYISIWLSIFFLYLRGDNPVCFLKL